MLIRCIEALANSRLRSPLQLNIKQNTSADHFIKSKWVSRKYSVTLVLKPMLMYNQTLLHAKGRLRHSRGHPR